MITWPVRLEEVRADGVGIVLRALTRHDRARWLEMREDNRDWLRPWEATVPTGPEEAIGFTRLRRVLDRAAREGRVLPFVIEADGVLVGQMQLFDIVWGSRWTASAGYWLDQQATGRGLAAWSLAMLIDHALHDVGLHRVEVAIRPENTASLAVARALALPDEGFRAGLVHVDGAWRDHVEFAITAEQLGGERLVSRLRAREST
ncbi:GNAT family N-acetyltransferase [Ornithinimicrobium ciconiae]|uniref:GNAT family N-acetyltransferase n=1 Tax=Ornithinimicrobium ciconiae TaxID=2594265 RepID=A0A516GE88_9MICO|nr:GNAT family protein [Ornithinimicrobium ciconiae]QDO89808.1 GNAT family N-acetyltransferase [Ornithinimicrobium ciconiae]